MGDGTKENPFTRAAIEAKIKDHGGPEGLDLSGKVFEENINLNSLYLHKIILNKATLVSAKFNGSNMSEAKLCGAHLEQAKFNKYDDKSFTNLMNADLSGADLYDAELIGAFLNNTNFRGANLTRANLRNVEERTPDLHFTDFRGAHLFLSDFTGRSFLFTKLEGTYLKMAAIYDAHLEDADWGSYEIGEETGEEKRKDFYFAESIYRRLKQWYTNAGHYDIAGEFLFREMEAKRKNLHWLQPRERRWLGWWPLQGQKVRLNVYKWLYGYGERPWRVVAWGGLVLFGLALIYFFFRGVAPYTLTVQAFLGSLYYSAVSFTALGYGPWFSASSVRSWVQGVGAAEAIVGVFMIALFLITFVRKMTR